MEKTLAFAMFDGVGLQKTRKTHLVGGFKDFLFFRWVGIP
jgi:hypothetical protein